MNKIEKFFDRHSNAARREAGAPFYTTGQLRKSEQRIMKGIFYFLIISLLVIVFAAAVKAEAAVTVGDTETTGTGNGTTLVDVVVDQDDDLIVMQAAAAPGSCTRDGQDFVEYDSIALGYDAYDAHLLYLETPNIGTASIVCTNSVGLTAAVFEGDGALTFTGVDKDYSDTSPGNFTLTSGIESVKVGVMGFSQNTWSCSSGCTAVNSGGNRGGVIYTSVGEATSITVAQSSNGMLLVYGEIIEAGGGGPDPETGEASSGATSTPNQVQQNLFNSFQLLFYALFFITWFFKRRL